MQYQSIYSIFLNLVHLLSFLLFKFLFLSSLWHYHLASGEIISKKVILLLFPRIIMKNKVIFWLQVIQLLFQKIIISIKYMNLLKKKYYNTHKRLWSVSHTLIKRLFLFSYRELFPCHLSKWVWKFSIWTQNMK